ncbi:hypothetical protein BC6_00001 [Bacillus phage BC-6]|nr:hypothetical protein BC6_00001 [Bacillus phage BC-6]
MVLTYKGITHPYAYTIHSHEYNSRENTKKIVNHIRNSFMHTTKEKIIAIESKKEKKKSDAIVFNFM